MKLSKRERVLIIILFLVLAVYAVYKFIPETDTFNLGAIKSEYNQKLNEYNNMRQNILLKDKYDENVQRLTEEINNLNVLSDLKQEKLIVFLNNYFANNKINASNISFTKATIISKDLSLSSNIPKAKSSLEMIMDDINNKEIINNGNNGNNGSEATEENQNTQGSLTVKAITVNITFESTYENLIKFIDAIQNQPFDISITSINTVFVESEATDAEEKLEDIIQGDMVLNLYEVPKLDTYIEQNEDWIWKDTYDI